jgi:hypothetical protein
MVTNYRKSPELYLSTADGRAAARLDSGTGRGQSRAMIPCSNPELPASELSFSWGGAGASAPISLERRTVAAIPYLDVVCFGCRI